MCERRCGTGKSGRQSKEPELPSAFIRRPGKKKNEGVATIVAKRITTPTFPHHPSYSTSYTALGEFQTLGMEPAQRRRRQANPGPGLCMWHDHGPTQPGKGQKMDVTCGATLLSELAAMSGWVPSRDVACGRPRRIFLAGACRDGGRRVCGAMALRGGIEHLRGA